MLYEEVVRTAGGLLGGGSQDGALVLLWAPNSPEWVIAYFAIVAAGKIVIPLDDQSTPGHLQVVLRQSWPGRIFTTSGHLPAIKASGISPDTLCYLFDVDDSHPSSWRRAGDGKPVAMPVADPQRVTTLLYTSGTTGTPKGVPLTHRNLMSNVQGLLRADIITQKDRVLLPLPLHHAYPATVGMLCVLACGAAIVLPSGISGPELTTAANRSGATILVGVPRLYKVLIDSVETGIRSSGFVARNLYPLLLGVATVLRRVFGVAVGRLLFRRVHRRVGARLRILASGGAKLEPQLAAKLEVLGWMVLTGYGLSETSPVVTFNTPRRRLLESQGIPVSGVEITIDRSGDESYGEILVKGPNVFSGYWKNEGATRQAFTTAGWFRTNDLGYVDPDGFLHVVGRKSEVLVLSDGKKISPEELERVYEASRFIREAALLECDGKLAAIIVPDEEALRIRGTMSEEALLRDELARELQHLPPYQRAAEFRLVRQSLPRTRLGKLRRHLLPEIFAIASASRPSRSADTLAEEDRQLLQTPTVQSAWHSLQQRYAGTGISLDSSPQLDLGIDSLAWISLTTELEEKCGIALGAEALSHVLSVRDLLQVIDSASIAARTGAQVVDAGRLRAERYLEEPTLPLKGLRFLTFGLSKALMRGCFRLRIDGLENLPDRGPFVIAPNHASYLDPVVLAAALPARLLKSTRWAGWAGKMHKGPVFRTVSRATGVFPVDPDRDLGGGIRLGEKVLESGRALVWFPEGRRSADGELQAFRRGVGVLLHKNRVPVVPVYISGSFQAWPITRRWPRLHPIKIVFGHPESVESLLHHGRGDDEAARISDGLAQCVTSLRG
jgi:long-chain acyl-CoA synthetase